MNPLMVCRSVGGSPAQPLVARGGGGNLYCAGRGLITGGPGFLLAGIEGTVVGGVAGYNACEKKIKCKCCTREHSGKVKAKCQSVCGRFQR